MKPPESVHTAYLAPGGVHLSPNGPRAALPL